MRDERRGTAGDRPARAAGWAPLLRVAVLVLAAAATTGAVCHDDGQRPRLPSPSQVDGVYGNRADVTLNGNVVDVRARQDAHQLERGGDLWARVGPYIYVFSPQTQEILQKWPGVAAVRVRTVTDGGEWVAEATLRRDALNALTWKEARRRVARARQQGTEKPGYVEDLVDYGEDITDHRYNPAYVDGDG